MLELKHISKNFGRHQALKDISFKIPAGKITGLLGPNGAGKTTTMRIITGILAANQGQILFRGQPVEPRDWHFRFHLGYLPEDNPLYDFLTPHEYLRFIGKIRRVNHLGANIQRLARQLFFADQLSRPLSHLSKGYRQRVGLAASFLGRPSLVILDEPLSGLDPNQQQKVRQFLLRSKKTILFSSHILSEVQAICQQVVIIHRGKIIASGPINQLLQKPSLILQVKGATLKAIQTVLAKAHIAIVRHQKQGAVLTVELTSQQPLNKLQNTLWQIIRRQPRWQLLQLKTSRQSLETVFQQLTQ